MKELFIIGAGSVGGHIAINFEEYDLPYTLKGFLDDDPKKIGTELFGLPVIGSVSDILDMQDKAVIIGIAFPRIKEKIVTKISQNKTLEYPTLISPHAWLSKETKVGKGTIIYPGCSINYGTVIGDFIMMNMNCALGHDSQLGNYTSLAPGVNLGGHTQLGRGVDMGIGAVTKQFMKIEDYAIVGGQSMIIRTVQAHSTVAGVPAAELPVKVSK